MIFGIWVEEACDSLLFCISQSMDHDVLSTRRGPIGKIFIFIRQLICFLADKMV